MTICARVLTTVFVLTAAVAVATGQGRPDAPPLVPEAITGQESFERYCAACHGPDGRGDGPAAAALRSNPPDLTTITRRSGGAFSRDEMAAFIEGAGRSVPAHGTGDMPVWGPIFGAFDRSDVRTQVRLRNLVTYLESIQAPVEPVPPVPVAESGQQLYRAYCASCHGIDGRGAGPVSEALRNIPPDLTEYALRNDDVFPSEPLRQIIDGRHVAAHGDTEMPVWGRVFMREPGGDAATARARIDALVAYLESIQQRRL